MENAKKIDTFNKFLVASSSSIERGIVFLKPVPPWMNPEDALLLAAYLVSMAEHQASHTFEQVLTAVQNC